MVSTSMIFCNVIVDVTFSSRSLMFWEVSAILSVVEGLALDLQNRPLSVLQFVLVFHVG